MNARLAVLGVWLAALPLAVDLPGARDSSRAGPLQVEVAGGGGQFAIVSRGCNGEVLRVTRNQMLSGALVVEQRLPEDFVIGVRAGTVRTTLHTTTQVYTGLPGQPSRDTTLTDRYSNPYVNPYVGFEGRWAGLGIGLLMGDRLSVITDDPPQRRRATWHARLGGERGRLTLRWKEDVPLESEGHLSVDLGFRPIRTFEAGAFAGLFGLYDGVMLGLRGRLWLTREAALQIKASVADGGAHGEYGVYGSVTAGLPVAR